MERIKMKIREDGNKRLIHNSRADILILAKAVNEIIQKVNEIVDELNKKALNLDVQDVANKPVFHGGA